MFLEADGRYRSDGDWWVIWPLERLVRENTGAWAKGCLAKQLVAFGDDGTGNPFCMALDGDGQVARWSWIDGEVQRSEGMFRDFMAEWVADKW